MLISEATKYGAGINIYGDYWDLKNFHQMIYDLSDDPFINEDLGDFMLGLAYEIRHAYQGDREEKLFGYDELDQVKYRGFKNFWPIFLFQIALIRWSAGFQPTTKEQQAIIYRIEHCAESALLEYDSSVGSDCIEWLRTFSGVSKKYLFLFVSEVCYNYVFSGHAGKSRFKKLPYVLEWFNESSEAYGNFKKRIESLAKQKECDPRELHDLNPWPKFKW